MDINNVVVVGRLTRNVEVQTTSSGHQVGKFGLAMNRVWTSNGNKQEKTTFIDVTVWGKMAETLAKHCSKGNRLGVVGRLEQDTWTDKNTGQKRSKVYVVAENFQFLEANKNPQQQNQYQNQGSYQQYSPQQQQAPSYNYQQQYSQPPTDEPPF